MGGYGFRSEKSLQGPSRSCSGTALTHAKLAHGEGGLHSTLPAPSVWVADKELNLSYYIGETRLFTIYTHYGNLI